MPGQIQKMALAALIFSEGFGKYFNVQFHRVHSPFLQRFFELLHSKKGSRLLKTVITERTLLFQENFVYCSFNSWRPIQSALCVKHPPWLKLDPALALGTLAPMVSFCLMPICEEPEFFFSFRRFFSCQIVQSFPHLICPVHLLNRIFLMEQKRKSTGPQLKRHQFSRVDQHAVFQFIMGVACIFNCMHTRVGGFQIF